MANAKGYPPPRVSAQPRAIEFLRQKFSAFFSATISLRKFPSSPQTKIWLLWQFPFLLCYDNIYDTSAKPCTCSEAINKLAVTILKYRGKRQVNTRVKGISHIYKRAIGLNADAFLSLQQSSCGQVTKLSGNGESFFWWKEKASGVMIAFRLSWAESWPVKRVKHGQRIKIRAIYLLRTIIHKVAQI